MRVAILSDIHGNRTAFDALLADLRLTAPDGVLHGGDLADAGSSPAYVLDRIRDLGWAGVVGNTDQMLSEGWLTRKLPFPAIEEMAAFTRDALGTERLSWLSRLPRSQSDGELTLVHASPGDLWRAPAPEASDEELAAVFEPLNKRLAVYAHIHRSFVRELPGRTVVNTGSVSLSHDGDSRAAYLLIDDAAAQIRRVEYDLDAERKLLRDSGLPYADWLARMLVTARPEMP